MGICFCLGTDYILTNYGDTQGSVCNDLTLELIRRPEDVRNLNSQVYSVGVRGEKELGSTYL